MQMLRKQADCLLEADQEQHKLHMLREELPAADDRLMIGRCTCRSYANFCACGKQLDGRLEALQGQRFADRLDVHREDLPAVDRWLTTLTEALGTLQLKTVGECGGNLHTSQRHGTFQEHLRQRS